MELRVADSKAHASLKDMPSSMGGRLNLPCASPWPWVWVTIYLPHLPSGTHPSSAWTCRPSAVKPCGLLQSLICHHFAQLPPHHCTHCHRSCHGLCCHFYCDTALHLNPHAFLSTRDITLGLLQIEPFKDLGCRFIMSRENPWSEGFILLLPFEPDQLC